ncbi:hypothetical protein GE09DRAFT_1139897 [Coniochaeta sp. 2T2.1]|nr:hypothetical protein GE09DRAFT_1139897 [Coniochaeta sp. 2T2.1]
MIPHNKTIMSSNMPDTEILVHIAAPSKASDDADYRALAAACLSFEPSTRTALGTVEQGTARHDDTRELAPDPALFRHHDDAFISPEMSFGSAIHNLSSPDLRRHQPASARDADESQSSWRAPPSVIEDSIPDNNISFARYSSPTRILEHYLQGFDSSQSSSSQPIPSTAGPPSSPFRPVDSTPAPAARVDRAFALPPRTTRSIASSLQVIPQTPSPALLKRKAPVEYSGDRSDTRVVSSVPDLEPPPTTSNEVPPHQGPEHVLPSAEAHMVGATPCPSSQGTVIPSSRADSEPPQPPTKRHKRMFSGVTTKSLARSTSDIGPRQDNVKKTQLDRRQRARQTASGLEIHSPEPPVGCQDLTVSNVVTPKLEKLAKDVGIRKRFQPKEQGREIRPFERGYWHVDCSGWPDNIKRDTWGNLTDYVSNGYAGWGIWCRRSQDYGWIRLYCWGCVIGHMHLLLYTASRRELNYTGTAWVGGDGEVVVVMEPKYERNA